MLVFHVSFFQGLDIMVFINLIIAMNLFYSIKICQMRKCFVYSSLNIYLFCV